MVLDRISCCIQLLYLQQSCFGRFPYFLNHAEASHCTDLADVLVNAEDTLVTFLCTRRPQEPKTHQARKEGGSELEVIEGMGLNSTREGEGMTDFHA